MFVVISNGSVNFDMISVVVAIQLCCTYRLYMMMKSFHFV